jgi:predicted nucleic acid-binding Zn ribbon protein
MRQAGFKTAHQDGDVIFKGSGFYATDYRSENYKQSVKKETPAKTSEKKETTPAKITEGHKEKGKGKK